MKEFTEDVNNMMSKGQLIEKYGISSDNVKKIARQLGLTIKRATKPKFELIMDLEETITQAPQEITNDQVLNTIQ
jgi:hypothetical protein